MKKITSILLSMVIILLFVSCSKSVQIAIIPDQLVGSWQIAGIYYEDKLIDLDDSEELKDLYDSIMLSINKDGTFCYINFINYSGIVQTTEETNTYILKTENLTKFKSENGHLKEVPDTQNDSKDFVVTILSEEMDTLLFNEYDGKNLHPKISNSTYILTKNGTATSYILDNKVQINGNSNSSSNANSATNSYSNNEYTKSYNSYTMNSYGATSGEQNALEKAYDYLDYTAFSYSGLVDQLKYEGFSESEATYAADNCGADWNEQAVKKAKQYLDYSAFSRSGLVDQLEYEGFTSSQAEYGVSVAY